MSEQTPQDDWVAQVRSDSISRLEAVQRMQEQLRELVGEGHSDQGRVRVRVTPAGMLTDLRLSQQALELEPDDLSAEIMATIATATVEVSERLRQVVGEVVPAADLDAMMRGDVSDDDRRDVAAQIDALRAGTA